MHGLEKIYKNTVPVRGRAGPVYYSIIFQKKFLDLQRKTEFTPYLYQKDTNSRACTPGLHLSELMRFCRDKAHARAVYRRNNT